MRMALCHGGCAMAAPGRETLYSYIRNIRMCFWSPLPRFCWLGDLRSDPTHKRHVPPTALMVCLRRTRRPRARWSDRATEQWRREVRLTLLRNICLLRASWARGQGTAVTSRVLTHDYCTSAFFNPCRYNVWALLWHSLFSDVRPDKPGFLGLVSALSGYERFCLQNHLIASLVGSD